MKPGITIILIFISVFLLQPMTVPAEELLQSAESSCCSIKYSQASYLDALNARIGGYRYTSSGLDRNPANVIARIDNIMSRVQANLDMYPDNFRITILLLPDASALESVFRTYSLTGHVPLAFYAHKSGTIYVAVGSVTEGVLAHEMAHAVINAYFPVPPPARMQEILARYVDLHIRD